MGSSRLCYTHQGALARGFSRSFACRAALVSDAESEQGKRGNKSGMMMCTSANTQLDSLLYPRDERSAAWAFPCCDLAPFGDSESCTHVHISPKQYSRGTSSSLLHSYTLQPAKHTVYICQSLENGI